MHVPIFISRPSRLLPLAILATCCGVHAQEQSATMPDVVVTATRAQTASEAVGGTSVSVITAEDIEAKGFHTVEEIVKTVPGLHVAATGGRGAKSSVFIRGADSKNALVLIDGVMYNDPSDANRAPDLANLTVDNVERIEIVRGPLSALYGSNATAGVINIITRRGEEGTAGGFVSMEGGSYGSWTFRGTASGGGETYDYSVTASRTNTGGFSAASADNNDIPHAGNTDEDDGWQNTTLSANAGYRLLPELEIRGAFRYADSTIELDDWGPGYAGDRFDTDPATGTTVPAPDAPTEQETATEQYTGRVDLKSVHFEGTFASDFHLRLSNIQRDTQNADGRFNDAYDGETLECGWEGTLDLADWNSAVSFGAAHYEETASNRTPWGSLDEKEAYTRSAWVQEQYIAGGFDLVAGVRWDDHENFGSKATFRIAPAYTINDSGTTLKASYGTGFRAPSLYELYDPTSGNSELEAEESSGWDIGLEQRLLDGQATIGTTYFNMVFDNRIDWVMTDPMTYSGNFEQVEGETKTQGVETYATWQPSADLSLRASYTYTDTEDPNGKRLLRRPLHTASAGVGYQASEELRLNAELLWAGKRDAAYASDKDGNPVDELDAYTVVTVTATYDVTENVQLQGRIENLFDEEYEEAWSYATPGLSGYAGVKVRF